MTSDQVLVLSLVHNRVVNRAMEAGKSSTVNSLSITVFGMTLAGESIERGVLHIPFGQPLKTRGIYSLCLQPSAASHPACGAVMQWFAQQAATPPQ